MNLRDALKKIFSKKDADTVGRFSDFFLHAPAEKKIKVFTEVARKANEEQREIFQQSTFKPNPVSK